jgi:hypothetical protein
MPVPMPPTSRPLLRRLITNPWTAAARASPGVRTWCDQHGYITPHFTWRSYACTDGTAVPKSLRANAIRLHWRLELMRHRIGDVPMTVDGPFRTHARNTQVHGAPLSRHIQADAADFFVAQIEQWIRQSPKLHRRDDVVKLAERTFFNGGVGNEGSGTLHLDTRGSRARFFTWTHSG